MPPYKFRLRFLLPSGFRINSLAERLDLSLPHGVGDVELIGQSQDKTIASSGELIVRSKGLPSLEQAQEAGLRVQAACLLVGAELGLGVDLGREAPRSHLTEYGRQWLAAQTNYDGQLLDDHLGLVVYDDPQGTRFVKMEANAIVGKPIERFTQALATHVRREPLDDKHILALELYNTAHFESSSRARFVTLVSAVETLALRESRPPGPLALVQGWLEQLAPKSMPPEDKDPLRSALNELRSESCILVMRYS